jgi:hypothetical protein
MGKAEYVVHFRGNKIDRPVRSWERVRRRHGFQSTSSPIFSGTPAQPTSSEAGVPIWEAANALGMSVQVMAALRPP